MTPLVLKTAASTGVAGMRQKYLGFGTTIIIISNQEMEDVMKKLSIMKILIY